MTPGLSLPCSMTAFLSYDIRYVDSKMKSVWIIVFTRNTRVSLALKPQRSRSFCNVSITILILNKHQHILEIYSSWRNQTIHCDQCMASTCMITEALWRQSSASTLLDFGTDCQTMLKPLLLWIFLRKSWKPISLTLLLVDWTTLLEKYFININL